MPVRLHFLFAFGLAAAAIAGCSMAPAFPARPVAAHVQELAFDMNEDGRDDYWQRLDDQGQKVELRFDTNGDGKPDETVRPADLPPSECVHAIIVLDGVPFEVAASLYDEGWLRLFPRPSRAVSVFPVMTDLALSRVFTEETCLGYEAQYWDRARKRPSDGNWVYLSGANAPWRPRMDYSCSIWLDAKSYLDPESLWRDELGGITRAIRRSQSGTVRVYSVATAGLATRRGRDAIVDCLQTVDRLCERLTWERRGRIRFTIFADHGHDLVPAENVDLRPHLEAAGFRSSQRLNDHRSVYIARFGLVSCAVLNAQDPQGVAEALVTHPAVDLVAYPKPAAPGNSVIVVRRGRETAEISRDEQGGFLYQTLEGDPLRLAPIRIGLSEAGKLAANGAAADRDWLDATVTHEYPDPLYRVWLAFNGLVQNPADVIVSLKEGCYTGSGFFSAMVSVASTHGALTQRGSTTFAVSNHVALPPTLRVEDLAAWVRPE